MSEKIREASVISSQPDGTRPRLVKKPVCKGNDAAESKGVIWGEETVFFKKRTYSCFQQLQQRSYIF